MNFAPPCSRLLFNPFFRALWIGMIASNLVTVLYAGHTSAAAPASTPGSLLIAAVNMVNSLPMYLLVLLSVVMSWYVHQHGHRQFAFRKMGSGAFAVSILTFLGFVGPWVLLCTALILGLCAAIVMLSFQPVLLARAAGNLVSGVIATLMGPAAIFILSAVSLCAIFIASKKYSLRGDATAMPSAQ